MDDLAPACSPDLVAPPLEGERPTLAADLRQLADHGRTLVEAEIAYQKSRAAYAGAESRGIAIMLVVAAVLVFFAVMAAVVGTVIALGPLLGPWGAMAVVTGVLLLVAFGCAVSAKRRVARMTALLSEGDAA